ncbi:MAG: amino acid adenylation domain-containing protein, partial [Lutisporaceae bacterium]
KANSLLAFENQDYQFEELIDKLNVTRDLSRNPLFDVMFSMQNMDTREIQIEGLKFKPYEIDNSIAKFDMTITAIELNKTIGIDLNYCTKLFNKQIIENMIKHLINILNSIVNNTNLRLSEVEMLSAEEKQQVLVEFNNTTAEYPKDKTLYQLFEQRAAETPDNIAVIYEEQSITYKELDAKSNQLARTLREKGVKPNSIVGIMVERSLEMLIGIMGILKAGGAYLPIDPEYPEDRISYILEDSKTKLLLTQGKYINKVEFDGEILNLESEQSYTNEGAKLDNINSPKDIAYLIYTSGSTGKPKGVMIEHESAVNILSDMERNYPLTKEDVYLLKTSYTFDVSVTEIFGWFVGNGKLAILKPEDEKDVSEILNAIERYKVTHINFVPSMLNLFLEGLDEKNLNKTNSLKYVFAAGEALIKETVNRFHKLIKTASLENIYGPTETTIYVTRYSLNNLDKDTKNIPIGKPLSNIKAYIIDKNRKLQPVGIQGELCFSGIGLGRGYLNRPELTAEKFIENPFATGERMYKTGDLAKWLPDGNIEFLGRIDHQVKIRGFRIELGEIESQLLKYEGISEVIVIAKEDKNKSNYLCGYICGEREYSISELREYLAKELPEYMIPSYIIQLDKLPLTGNGKVDRKALPEPDGSITTGVEYVAPSNKIEEKLSEIWSEVLGIERVGINDNFFELGGHSLKAINIAAKINKELNVSVPLREMFKTPTIKGLANYVEGTKQSMYSKIEAVEEKEHYTLSSAQKRIYTLQQFEEDSISYNMPMVMTIEGELDKTKLEETFNKLIQRHEALRTSFELVDGEPIQVVHKSVSFEIEYTEADKEKAEEIAAGFVKAFDLSKAPLIRVALAKIKDKEHMLMIDMHHIISDGVSMGILIKEFIELYDGKELPRLRIQYKDFAAWQNELFKSGEINKQEEYWLKAFDGEVPVLNMPTDYQRPSIQSFEGDSLSLELSEELTNKLKQIAKETGSTMYMVLLSAYNVLLSKYSGQEDIVVGSPIAGRPHADLENIMGMFVNTLAMRNFPQGNKTFKEFLEEVKANSLLAFENQDYQFEELIDKLNVTRDLSRNPLFDVMFSMQN